MEFDEWETVQDLGFFKAAWWVTGGVVILFALQSYLPVFKSEDLGLQFVAFLGATIMLLLRPKLVGGSTQESRVVPGLFLRRPLCPDRHLRA